MMQAVVFLLALGLSLGAHIPATQNFPIYGFSEHFAPSQYGLRSASAPSLAFPYYVFGERTWAPVYPYTLPSGIIPTNYFAKEFNAEHSLYDILHKPVIAVHKSTEGSEDGLVMFYLQNGLSSIAEYPHTRYLHDMLMTHHKAGLIVNPSSFYAHPALRHYREMSVVKMEIPAGMKFAHFARFAAGNVPFIFIHDAEEFKDFEGVTKYGSFEITEGSPAFRSS